MKYKAHPVPKGLHTVTPYLIIRNAASAVEFYKKAFGATEVMRFADPRSGKIGHAEIKIGDSSIMMADEYPEMQYRSPQTLNGSSVLMQLYVPDVDAVFNQAVAAGATVLRPVADQFYGDRSGAVADPFGHLWNIATHKEDVSDTELLKRSVKAFEKKS